MISEHSYCDTPPDSQQIWKYLNLEGLISLLQNRALWFSNANLFEDPFEGTFVESDTTRTSSIIGAIPFPLGRKADPEDEKNSLLVNCWHASEDESYAMWKIYSDVEIGIALKTTFGKLNSSLLNTDKEIYAGFVRYERRAQVTKRENLFEQFLRKDPVFRFENEVRLLMSNENHQNDGYKLGEAVPISLNEAISELVISPYSKPWQKQLIVNLLNKYELNVDVKASSASTP